jgi:succinylarginine dihydrolase
VRSEELKRDLTKKLSSIYRDLEKMQVSVERKVAMDVFNERLEAKADKQMVLNATINKVSKGEVEQLFLAKADKRDVDGMIRNLQQRMEEDLGNMGECLARKANLDDLQYFSKELSIKLDKGELDAFRQEFVDRIAAFEQKLYERN